VGDFRNGNIYEMRSDVYTDNGDPIVAVRIAQHQADKRELGNIIIHKLVVDAETGVGLVGPAGVAPMAALAWSDDGGHTYSSDYAVAMGAMGKYNTRMIWRKLGRSRDRVFRLAMADPVKKVLIGAYIEATA
jgi:hypothetical protein